MCANLTLRYYKQTNAATPQSYALNIKEIPQWNLKIKFYFEILH
ncbi:hypothetical protein [Helicobacter sp. MIT 05-5294]|nr:hypothetical protein [Helicobacter sp. MIT 05-5294]